MSFLVENWRDLLFGILLMSAVGGFIYLSFTGRIDNWFFDVLADIRDELRKRDKDK